MPTLLANNDEMNLSKAPHSQLSIAIANEQLNVFVCGLINAIKLNIHLMERAVFCWCPSSEYCGTSANVAADFRLPLEIHKHKRKAKTLDKQQSMISATANDI